MSYGQRMAFYKSMPWRRAREAYIQKRINIDGGLCEVCHTTPGQIVHHVVWLNDNNVNDPEISLNDDNFRYECQTCHNQEEARQRQRYRFNSDGNVIRNA